jgi:hypothetical protein
MSSYSLTSSAIAPVTETLAPDTGANRLPADPWRDPHSVPVLGEARAIEPRNFFAQFTFAELQYRLRAINVAEKETL